MTGKKCRRRMPKTGSMEFLDQRTRAMHFNSIAIGVGSAVIPSVVRHGAAAGSGKYSAQTAL
jgi:hypothetical protein